MYVHVHIQGMSIMFVCMYECKRVCVCVCVCVCVFRCWSVSQNQHNVLMYTRERVLIASFN